jgi:hypothetical protein
MTEKTESVVKVKERGLVKIFIQCQLGQDYCAGIHRLPAGMPGIPIDTYSQLL